MESHRCETPQGVGAPQSEKTSESEACHHVTERGHRCRMLSVNDSGLCPYHARTRFRPAADPNGYAAISDDTANELLANISDFKTHASVNLFLGNLIQQVVHKRIARNDATTLAYLAQLLLNSVSSMSRDLVREQESRPRVIVMDGIFSKGFEEERMRKHAEEMAARHSKV